MTRRNAIELIAAVALLGCRSSEPFPNTASPPVARLPPIGLIADSSNVGPRDTLEIAFARLSNGQPWSDSDDVSAGKRLLWFIGASTTGAEIGPPIASEPLYGGANVSGMVWRKLTFRRPQPDPGRLEAGWFEGGKPYPDGATPRTLGDEWVYDAQRYFIATSASCPHPALGWAPSDGYLYIRALEYAFSEPLDPASITNATVSLTYGGQVVTPTSVTLESRIDYDGNTLHLLVANLPPVLRGDGNGLPTQVTIHGVKGATGVPMAGNFHRDWTCTPSDFVESTQWGFAGTGRAGAVRGDMITNVP